MRAIARGQVHQKCSEGEICCASGSNAFYLSTGEKPDSINMSQKSQEVIRFCFTTRKIFQPRLDSGNNVPLCCKTSSRRYPRSLEQFHTCMVFSRFFTEKVTNNAGPKFMCLSSSLFVTYFLAVYQKPTNFLYFPLSIMLRVCSVRFPQKGQAISFPPSNETHLRFWMCYRALMDSFKPPFTFGIS